MSDGCIDAVVEACSQHHTCGQCKAGSLFESPCFPPRFSTGILPCVFGHRQNEVLKLSRQVLVTLTELVESLSGSCQPAALVRSTSPELPTERESWRWVGVRRPALWAARFLEASRRVSDSRDRHRLWNLPR